MEERKATYFISDCHLGARYIANPHEHEMRIVNWLESIAHDARELILLGDIIDYWFEYRYVVPRGYIRFFGALARLSDAGVKITWMKGNHDIWLFDYLRDEIGLSVVDGVLDRTIDGYRFVMTHGDGVGCDSRWFKIMRAMFRNPILQTLYAAIHPRWTVGFAYSWSAHNRMHGEEEHIDKLTPDDSFVAFANSYIEKNGNVDYFIFGHRHIVVDQPGPKGSTIVVLGDSFSKFSYGEFRNGVFKIKYF